MENRLLQTEKIRLDIIEHFIQKFIPFLIIISAIMIFAFINLGYPFERYSRIFVIFIGAMIAQILVMNGKGTLNSYVVIITGTISFIMLLSYHGSFRTVGGTILGAIILVWCSLTTSRRFTLFYYLFLSVSVGVSAYFTQQGVLSETNINNMYHSAFITIISYFVLIHMVNDASSIYNKSIIKMKNLEKDLQKNSEFIVQAMDHSNEFFGWLSNDGVLRFVNETAVKMVNVNKEDVVGTLFWDTPWFNHHPNEQRNIKTHFEQAMSGKESKYIAIYKNNKGANRYIDLHLTPIKDNNENVYRIVAEGIDITEQHWSEITFRSLSQNLSKLSGKAFYSAISKHIAKLLRMDYIFIAELNAKKNSMTIAGGYNEDIDLEGITYSLEGTPCSDVLCSGTSVYPKNVCDYYPEDKMLLDMNIQGYLGAVISGKDGEPLGIMVALSKKEIETKQALLCLFELFIDRVAVEIMKDASERSLHEQIEEKDRIIAELSQDKK